MRAPWALMALLLAVPAHGQEQQARAPDPPPAAGQPVYDIVAGDRETAWRINRVTGEILVCRVNTTGSLDAARARCAPAAMETPSQQSQLPVVSPPPAGGGRP